MTFGLLPVRHRSPIPSDKLDRGFSGFLEGSDEKLGGKS